MLRKNPIYKAGITVLFILACIGTLASGFGILAMGSAGYYEFNDDLNAFTGGDGKLLKEVRFEDSEVVLRNEYQKANLFLDNLVCEAVSASDVESRVSALKAEKTKILDTVETENGKVLIVGTMLPVKGKYEHFWADEYAISVTGSNGKTLWSSGIPAGESSAYGKVMYGFSPAGELAELRMAGWESHLYDKPTIETTIQERTEFTREEMAEYVEENSTNFYNGKLYYASDSDCDINWYFPFYCDAPGSNDMYYIGVNEILADMAWGMFQNHYYDYYYDIEACTGAIIVEKYVKTDVEYAVDVKVSLPANGDIPTDIALEKTLYDRFYPMRTSAFGVLIASVLIGFVTFILLIFAAGWKRGKNEPQRRWIDKIPFDVFTVITVVLGLLAFAASDEFDNDIAIGFIGLCLVILAPVYIFSFVRRIKTHTLMKNNLIVYLFKWAVKLFRVIPSIWTLVAAGVVYGIFSLIAIASQEEALILVWAVISLVLFGGLCVFDTQLTKLIKATGSIAKGAADTKVESEKFILPLKKHADDINSIGDAVSKAVEEQLASERMKTDLIANVSHDIKTPLTNIINYLDLLKRTNITDPTALEYIAVLDKQSVKLKRLVQDIVDASKASSGCINAECAPVDIRELLEQAVAEYSDKLAASGITPVVNREEDCTAVMADGRLLWRVFDNLLSNIYKYSQPGTRAYIDAKRAGENVEISFRNISAEALNISPETLMERFVRGDRSRHTDGSGLGLSIARSLVELQGGTFSLAIDGDLFRAVVSLPACELPEKPQDAENENAASEEPPVSAQPAIEAESESLPQLPEPEIQPLTEDKLIVLPPILPEEE